MAEEKAYSSGNTSQFETTRRKRQRAARKDSLDTDDYFERVSLWYYFVVILGFMIFEIFCFHTNQFPFERLGGAGKRLDFLASNHMNAMKMGFLSAILLHILEAMYSHFQCRSANLSTSATRKWTIQTFILGYSSLRLLNAYCAKKNAAAKRL